MKYQKPWLPISEQVQKLKDRGLVVRDVAEAERMLRYANYYRFTGFCLRFQYYDKTAGERRFIDGTTFEDMVARDYGLQFVTMQSWLHTMTYVRNICAHHARLWDKTLNIAPQIPGAKNWQATTVPQKSVAFVALMLNWMLAHDSVKPDAHKQWQAKLEKIIDAFISQFPQLAQHTGFAPSWKKNPLWWQV